MTAGSGIEHSEMPEQQDGWMSGFQLWVNLPAAQKMSPPRYQEFEPEEIPVERRADGSVLRVIAGITEDGTEGAVKQITAQPIYFDVSLPPGGHLDQAIPSGHTAFVHLIEGRLSIECHEIIAGSLAVLGEGDHLNAQAGEDGARFLLVAGKPINEPVARSGPFVMNTDEEIRQAYADYRSGQFGHVKE